MWGDAAHCCTHATVLCVAPAQQLFHNACHIHQFLSVLASSWSCVQGVPLRLELGARDLGARQVVLRQRTGGDRRVLPDDTALPAHIQSLLNSMQTDMLAAAVCRLDANTVRVNNVSAFHDAIAAAASRVQPTAACASSTHTAGSAQASRAFTSTSPFILAPWCDDAAEEARVKEETKFTIRCFPSAEQAAAAGERCFWTGRPATHIALFARAF